MTTPPAPPQDEDWRQFEARQQMVTAQIEGRGIGSPRVLEALREVPRHAFVPPPLRDNAYADHPLSIGHGQTISQPYIVALMTALARPAPADRALEIGTGCGYQTAVLARLVSHVYSVEIEPELHRNATERLARLGYDRATTVQGDGHLGWPPGAPYDIILVTAAPETVPPALLEQLAPGGRLVIPVGPRETQRLELIEKDADGRTTRQAVAPVMFVPLVQP
jgi:protein-L-isoaspartate(D-aspartate) O-methyltransferase